MSVCLCKEVLRERILIEVALSGQVRDHVESFDLSRVRAETRAYILDDPSNAITRMVLVEEDDVRISCLCMDLTRSVDFVFHLLAIFRWATSLRFIKRFVPRTIGIFYYLIHQLATDSVARD